MADLHRESLSKLTVAALKDELSARNLSTSGLKDELVERLQEALERELSCDDVPESGGEAEGKKREEPALEGMIMQLMSLMKEGQRELKTEMTEMKDGQREIKEKFEEIEGKFEGKLKEMERKFEKLKQEMEVKVTEESRESNGTSEEFGLAAANQFQSAQHMPVINKSCMKLLPYDGQTSWQVYKTQFAIVAEANGWDLITKARQLAASLRAEAADILRTVPENEQLNFDTLSSALELRFGEKCLKDYSRLQLKTRQQKSNETLQELATDIEKLSHLAFSDCPTEVRETLAVQYFVDGVRDTEIQKALRMAETKDLKSALVYAIKFEAAQQASRRDRHSIRGAEVKQDEGPLLKVMKQLLEEFRESKQKSGEEADKFKRNKARCWKCGSENHLQRQCQARQEQRPRSQAEKKYDKIMPAIRQIKDSVATQIDLWSDKEVREAQLRDPDIKPISELIESASTRPSWQDISSYSPDSKRYWALWDSLHIRNGVLYRKWESVDGKTSKWQLVLPRSRIPEVLEQLHSSPTGGHFGVSKTIQKIRERFFWNKVRDDVEKWCKSCDACRSRKGPKTRCRGKLQRYNVGAPFERIALDILGPLPRSTDDNKYILVVMDYFTKWPEAYPIPNQEATTVAEMLLQNWISRYGTPLQMHSDQGRNFTSAVFKALCALFKIDKTQTTPLHPQSDGMVERFNRTILNHLSIHVSKNQQDWDRKLPMFLLAYRSAVHETTGFTPSQMLFGRELRLPCDLLFGRPPDAPSSPEEYVHELQERLEGVHEFARNRIDMATEKMKTRYDTRATGNEFHEGDKVWFWNPIRRKGLSPKLQSNWEGPYTVLKRLNDVVIRIRKSRNSRPRIVHCDRLAPYFGSSRDKTN